MIEEPPLLTVRRPGRRPTEAQIAAFRDTQTGFVADALGGGQSLDAGICPLDFGGGASSVAGPALTADNRPGDVLATMAALSFLQPGDVLIVATGGHQGCAAAGDRIAGMAQNAGAVAMITDGPMRDLTGMAGVGLPVWCTGLTPASPYAKGPARVGLPVQCGGQRIETGDIIVADADGVVVVPFDQIDDVIETLKHIRTIERKLDAEVAEGRIEFPHIPSLLKSDQTKFVD
ncbi:RraA family protein [Oceaniglobus indicus]|uniref:RraA family protein n=1 Tax=Oceaniglobus indicus TaxID=2047749 RepID=UPI000C17CAFF|nr:RraA family protein [Oceaniglobus indicus]